jgi:hypothetical protein
MAWYGSKNELCFLDISRELALVFSLRNELLSIKLIRCRDRVEQAYSPEPQCECS